MRILIIGTGICGLGTALLLARDGHDITLLERDDAPTPESPQQAWDAWARPGVAQFRQPHNFMPGLRLLLESELPDVQAALGQAGATKFDFVNPLPPPIARHGVRPLDEQLWTLTSRRPLGEWVFADAARREPRVTIRRNVDVRGLSIGPEAIGGVPHVVGVRTAAGEELRADLVVDASGRQSRSPDWLEAAGARRPFEEQADCGFIYYTRYFQGTEPRRMAPVLTPGGTISLLTLPGDNGTWSVTIFTATGDQPLKSLRDENKWTNTVRAFPLHAHWLDGEPITGVLPMAGIVDRYRRFVVDNSPVATGFVAVADAASCTNPSAGRGLTVGFLHGRLLRDVVRSTQENPRALVEEFDARSEAEIRPWYDAQIAADRMRFAEMNALCDGQRAPEPNDALSQGIRSLFATMAFDPDLFRVGLEYIGTITPVQGVLSRPAVRDAIRTAMEALKAAPPPPLPGPNRQQLLDIVN